VLTGRGGADFAETRRSCFLTTTFSAAFSCSAKRARSRIRGR